MEPRHYESNWLPSEELDTIPHACMFNVLGGNGTKLYLEVLAHLLNPGGAGIEDVFRYRKINLAPFNTTSKAWSISDSAAASSRYHGWVLTELEDVADAVKQSSCKT